MALRHDPLPRKMAVRVYYLGMPRGNLHYVVQRIEGCAWDAMPQCHRRKNVVNGVAKLNGMTNG